MMKRVSCAVLLSFSLRRTSGCAFGCLIILPALSCFVHDVSGTLCTRHVASGCLIEYAGVLSIPSISRVYNVVLQLFGQFKVSNKPITLHGMLRSTLAYCFTFRKVVLRFI